MSLEAQGGGLTFFQALIRTATAAATVGVAQMAAQPQPQTRRKRKKAECTPCAAMDLADKVRENVRKNRLFGDGK